MSCRERALRFSVAGEDLFGILSETESPAETGLLLIVGGPQYRVGSHRQFTLLSRRIADNGFPVLRFDYRGMGDSSGAAQDFKETVQDIAGALDTLQAVVPSLRRIVLWGLCDAASAALMYWRETGDARIAGMCLLNPWVRSPETLARTQVKHYYGQRLREKEFWLKLFSGKVAFGAVKGFLGNLRLARNAGAATAAADTPFQHRMAAAWKAFPAPLSLIISGDDYTAKEFLETAATDQAWAGALDRSLHRLDVAAADHTFSSAAWRAAAEMHTLAYLNSITQDLS